MIWGDGDPTLGFNKLPEFWPIAIWSNKIGEAALHQGRVNIFSNDILPSDIKQGALGDCWFLAALAALAEEPDLIRRLFGDSKANKHGVYEAWLVKWASATPVRGHFHFPLKSDFPQVHCPILKPGLNGPETSEKADPQWDLHFQKAHVPRRSNASRTGDQHPLLWMTSYLVLPTPVCRAMPMLMLKAQASKSVQASEGGREQQDWTRLAMRASSRISMDFCIFVNGTAGFLVLVCVSYFSLYGWNLAIPCPRKAGRPESKRTLGHALGKSLGHLMRLGNLGVLGWMRSQNWPFGPGITNGCHWQFSFDFCCFDIFAQVEPCAQLQSRALRATSCCPRGLTGLAKAKLHGSYEKIEGGQP